MPAQNKTDSIVTKKADAVRSQDTADVAATKPAGKTRNKAGRPTENELERRKAMIMQVATELFFSQGYAATSLVDIAKGAGVATRTLYAHFGNKESIFEEVIKSQKLDPRVTPPIVSTGDTLFDVLMRVAHYACEVAVGDESLVLIRVMVAESKRFPDLMKKVANVASNRFRGNISKIFQDLEAAGLIPPGDHMESARLLIDLVLGNSPMLIYTDWDISRRSNTLLETKVEMFIQGRFGEAVAANARYNRALINS